MLKQTSLTRLYEKLNPGVKHWDDTFVFEAKMTNTLPPLTNVRTAAYQLLG
ncbi:hypothetical protein [Wolbachia endosymbiont of Mansonella perstans]|uniref:hypothetical protein n=1 Tax=Wolbachia endosymbiont of Mansonella perstans TaxID=229526 RepID=UPI001CE1EC1C|nr:hypothetical protein [Wolbachia endosymbiont of Mansonella perstans]MCA4774237.1 hypothetical protein [Wolbachia endosymbiont of Mansonella perstans]